MYPVVTITGPRQSGKTTLAKSCFQGLTYINLEYLEEREFDRDDPVGFFKRIPNEQFVLTGSRQLNVMESVSQSLAGRTAIVKLLPFSIQEIFGKYSELGESGNLGNTQVPV